MNSDLYSTRLEMYGIRIVCNNEIIYEEKSDIIMSNESIKKVRLFYEDNNSKNIKFKIYTKCKSVNDSFMIWFNISQDDLNKYLKK